MNILKATALFITLILFAKTAMAEGVKYHLGDNGLCNHSGRDLLVKMYVDDLNYDGGDDELLNGQCLEQTYSVWNKKKWGTVNFNIIDQKAGAVYNCVFKLKGGKDNPHHHHRIKYYGCNTERKPDFEKMKLVFRAGHGDHTFQVDISQ